jgi:hypothetical protein
MKTNINKNIKNHFPQAIIRETVYAYHIKNIFSSADDSGGWHSLWPDPEAGRRWRDSGVSRTGAPRMRLSMRGRD